MKALLVTATLFGLLLFAAPTLADVKHGTGTSSDRASACDRAKTSASLGCTWGVRSYGGCECSKTEYTHLADSWTCTVDAYCKSRDSVALSIIPGLEAPPPVVRIAR